MRKNRLSRGASSPAPTFARGSYRLAGHLVAVALSLSALWGLSAACGAVGDACIFDSDCGGANLCVRETCYATCNSAADCDAPYDQCLVFTRRDAMRQETVRICVDESFERNNPPPSTQCKASGDCCASHAECAQLFGDARAQCASDNRCVIPLDSGP